MADDTQVPLGRLVHDCMPDWESITADVLMGRVWQDTRLLKRDRSLLTCALLVASGQHGPLKTHLERALQHGVASTEIDAMLTHCAFYAGWGCVEGALRVWHEVFRTIPISAIGPTYLTCRGLCCRETP